MVKALFKKTLVSPFFLCFVAALSACFAAALFLLTPFDSPKDSSPSPQALKAERAEAEAAFREDPTEENRTTLSYYHLLLTYELDPARDLHFEIAARLAPLWDRDDLSEEEQTAFDALSPLLSEPTVEGFLAYYRSTLEGREDITPAQLETELKNTRLRLLLTLDGLPLTPGESGEEKKIRTLRDSALTLTDSVRLYREGEALTQREADAFLQEADRREALLLAGKVAPVEGNRDTLIFLGQGGILLSLLFLLFAAAREGFQKTPPPSAFALLGSLWGFSVVFLTLVLTLATALRTPESLTPWLCFTGSLPFPFALFLFLLCSVGITAPLTFITYLAARKTNGRLKPLFLSLAFALLFSLALAWVKWQGEPLWWGELLLLWDSAVLFPAVPQYEPISSLSWGALFFPWITTLLTVGIPLFAHRRTPDKSRHSDGIARPEEKNQPEEAPQP